VTLVLAVNAGSTSLKLSAVSEDESAVPVASLSELPEGISAVAHRVVHGGARFRDPVVLDAEVERALAELSDLAPLHNPPAIAGIQTARRALPDVPHVAVFDTAFHATLPPVASTYAVPHRWREEWGIRRYGFQGMSVQWSAERVAVKRLVVCHLGGGCSITAVLDGRSVDTTMGFTPLEGVPMATRSGSLDPGAFLHLLKTKRLTVDELEQQLDRDSGLRGLSERTDRVDELEASRDPAADLALEVYTYRIAGAVASMAVALGGVDAVVFTAGVGEHSAFVRERVCRRLRHLGVELDVERNREAQPDAEVQAPGSRVRIAVVRAREDVIAARAARAVLGL
jgi:acetate kinase